MTVADLNREHTRIQNYIGQLEKTILAINMLPEEKRKIDEVAGFDITLAINASKNSLIDYKAHIANFMEKTEVNWPGV